MNLLNLELEVTGALFAKNYDVYGHVATDCWINHLWRFLFEHDVDVDEVTLRGAALRDGDKMLGDVFAQGCDQKL